MRATLAVLTISLIGCSTRPEGLPAEVATTTIGAQRVASVAFTEGPTVDRDGNVYFSEMLTGRILKYIPESGIESPRAGSKDARRSLRSALGGVETFRSESKGANGLIFDWQGRLIAAEGDSRRITRTDMATGEIEILAENGTVSNMRVFHDFYPGRSADGISIDQHGNLYAAGGLNRRRGSSETLDTSAGIHVLAPDGSQIGFFPIWEDTVTNCAFGGKDMKTLYVTAGKTLFSIRTEVPGTGR